MTAAPLRTVALQLQLHHTHPLGELQPYFNGLMAGRAIGSCCPVCARTWFPPRPDCPDHRRGVTWVELPGSGRIVDVTLTEGRLPFGIESKRRAFVLVRMDGAENHAFGRLAEVPDASAVGRSVWLSRAGGHWPHPAQAACYVLDERERVTEPLT